MLMAESCRLRDRLANYSVDIHREKQMNSCSKTDASHSLGRSSLDALVDVFIEKHRPGALKEKVFFESMPSLELAIHHAAFAMDDRDKRYAHQRRILGEAMQHAYHLLRQVRNRIAQADSFEDLHALLLAAFLGIHGLGALYTYDTALRLGFFLNLTPVKVYLHAGTRKGARALGIPSQEAVEISALPQSLSRLLPYEIEDFLCIFKPRDRR